MRPALPLALAIALCAGAGAAWAQGGINLAWDDCGTTGNVARTFACETNAGQNVMALSFAAPAGLPNLGSVSAVIDLQSSSATLPAWWSVASGPCRPGSLLMTYAHHAERSCDPTHAVCLEGSIGSATGFGAPNRARMTIQLGNAYLCTDSVVAGREYFLTDVVLDNRFTVGASACAGCETAVCIVLNSMTIGPVAGNPKYTISDPLDRQYVGWQSVDVDCPVSVPVARRTWGSIKSLYR